MTIEPEVFGIISLVSATIGGGLMLRSRLADTAETLKEHVAADTEMHLRVIGSLARVEATLEEIKEDRER